MIPFKQQRGSTLMVALIMLVLLTLIAVSAINSTTPSIQVVGNAQHRDEASAVAQQAIEQVISSSDFTVAPASSVISVDINKDGTPDYTAQIKKPDCLSSLVLTNAQLNFDIGADQKCSSSDKKTNTGIIGASGVVATTQSWCFKQSWEIQVTATDNNSGASTTIHQGVFLRVPADITCP